MGEIADMIIDGTFCQVCGALMEDLMTKIDKKNRTFDLKESPGYPRTCKDCLEENK